jgi:hypothetical protein
MQQLQAIIDLLERAIKDDPSNLLTGADIIKT